MNTVTENSRITRAAWLAPWLLCCLPWMPATAQESAPSAESQPAFEVREYRVLGNARLEPVVIERTLYPLLGPGKNINDIETARAALEAAYKSAGFGTVFVDIPEQQVEGGIVRLKVTEGRLDRVRIAGARYFSNGQIRAALPALEPGAAPNLPQLQTELAALNAQTPDRVIVPVLKAGRSPGTVDVDLKVDDELPLHGGIELNDRYTAQTERWRLNGFISYDNLFQRQHSLSLRYQTAPQEPESVQAAIATYTFRVPSWRDLTFAVYAVDSKTDVAALGALSVIGNGKIFGMRAVRSLTAPAPGYFHSVSLGVDYKDFLENIQLDPEVGLATPIRYLNWSAMYSATRRREASTTSFETGVSFGMRRWLNDSVQFSDKRFKGAPNYIYLSGGAQHLHKLPGDLQFFGRISAQLAPGPLVSNEQFGLGGVDSVRGYFDSQALGDDGVQAALELRSPSMAFLASQWIDELRAHLFFDTGIGRIHEPLPGQVSVFRLYGTGLGLRFNGLNGLSAAFDLGLVLRDEDAVQAGDTRAHFKFEYGF